MNRLTTGMVPLLALLVAVGCSGDPTGSFRGDTARIDAAPTQLFLQLGESKTVDVSAVDDQGNQISSVYEVTATGPGITVRRDSTFLPQYGNAMMLGDRVEPVQPLSAEKIALYDYAFARMMSTPAPRATSGH